MRKSFVHLSSQSKKKRAGRPFLSIDKKEALSSSLQKSQTQNTSSFDPEADGHKKGVSSGSEIRRYTTNQGPW